MKKIKIHVAAALFFAAMLCGSSCSKETETVRPIGETTRISARAAGPSANGQGTLIAGYLGDKPQHFSFHANTSPNGNVTGSFESTALGLDSRVHGRIDCLNILPDGKTAIMSGVVTVVTGDIYLIDFGFNVGDQAWFKVEDNGEGANATEDRFSDVYVFDELPPCTSDFDVELLEIANGNIQVKP
jgi:hypothetical protein